MHSENTAELASRSGAGQAHAFEDTGLRKVAIAALSNSKQSGERSPIRGNAPQPSDRAPA